MHMRGIVTLPCDDHYRQTITPALWKAGVWFMRLGVYMLKHSNSSQSRRGTYAGDKNTCAGTLAENRSGVYVRGGAHAWAGFYGIIT